jgi:5-oxoprolinase (ATP-hydrolysing)
MTSTPGWHIWIDRGGTFTDIVAISPDGKPSTQKLLSECPEQYDDAALEGIRRVLGVKQGDPWPAAQIREIHMGTTVATNALLERKGARTLLVTTRGLRDQLQIGYQHRPKLFVKQIRLTPPLYDHVIEIDERLDAEGRALVPLDVAQAEAALREARANGFDACAIVFMHGYRYHDHERKVADIARKLGFAQVSVSHEISPLMKFVSRGHTTVADAYLSPVLRKYVRQVSGPLGEEIARTKLRFMRSSGALATADHFSGKDALLSGPAGGVIGMAETAKLAGFDKVIGFDMGGTSTDVSRFDGVYARSFESEFSGIRIRAPMLSVHTVAAGGGSILFHENARMRVGPESAGANPGPACYRRGGPLTVTDANLLVGRVQPEFFPKVFGPKADQPLDADVVRSKFADLAARLGKTPEETADGYLDIAVANMAEAIKKISIAEGADVSLYALQCFGGAGAQLACRVADALGMRTIMIHPYAGILSAFGMGLAQVQARREKAVEASLSSELCTSLASDLQHMSTGCRKDVEAQGRFERIDVTASAHMRYRGTDTALAISFGTMEQLQERFRTAHEARFGFWDQGRELIVESVSVEATGVSALPDLQLQAAHRYGAPLKPLSSVTLFSLGQSHATPVYDRASLDPGDVIRGPAIIVEPNSTIVIDPHWQAEFTRDGNIVMSVTASRTTIIDTTAQADPVRLEIYNALFMSIAEQMGTTLEKTASSVNIKERLDFSCAIFDSDGNLIANAPHMPVHLGSMGESVRAVLDRHRNTITPGDAYAVNAPYAGGTHLPDITVVLPVYLEGDSRPSFYTAARGHHADVGGITPGSMPPNSTSVDEEGVLFNGDRIMAEARFDEVRVREILTKAALPARNPAQNIADLKAQIAACLKGAHELQRLCQEKGRPAVMAYMGFVQDNAEEQVRQAISSLSNGAFTHEMDDGARICVQVTIDRAQRTATIDFTGTSAQRPTNFNAPRAVTTAAVLYVFRCLIDSDIPLNAGCLRPLKIIAPEGSMLNPVYPAAVVAGNVETSQAVTDALFGALGIMAASQGTMNNFTFGNERHQYYETICGGAGAGPGFNGASAVHTHMTNSRLTDPEVLEFRYPVLLRRFMIRAYSGGDGAFAGGDGVVREVEFRETMDAGMLSTRRITLPFGIAGGGAGKPGRNAIRRANGQVEELGGCAMVRVSPGDVFVVETPGGGGYGTKVSAQGH